MPNGRPSIYSDDLADLICEELAKGEALHRLCERDDFPGESTVYRWLESKPDFREKYARARERQADRMAAEIVEIADDGSRDYKVDEEGRETVDHDHIARSRLRVDARKWAASKLAPKKYGDKVEQTLSGPDGGPIKTDNSFTIKFIRPAQD